jgi:putative endonuclease
MKANVGTRGSFYEQLAVRWLSGRGLRLLARNYRSRCGEIDLVMQHGEQIVFVEVKYRGQTGYGSPAEHVSRQQQYRIMRTAEQYIARHGLDAPCRFDVLGISGRQQPEFNWIINAFGG